MDAEDDYFNWATRSRAWKGIRSAPHSPISTALQLGHALSRVERWERHHRRGGGEYTSIGPRALARGKDRPLASTPGNFFRLQLGHALSRVERPNAMPSLIRL